MVKVERRLDETALMATGDMVPHFRACNHPVVASTNGSYINNIMSHIGRSPPSLPIPKAGALGATMTAKAGVLVDDIAWSSLPMFDHFPSHGIQHQLRSPIKRNP
ncbi:hypothetical protein DM01DRAFT_1407817 [Hesseltinella vesiculosa]|uniref:Uncharacterized protein n=1 Tax=Hesseltinella vesiculosa TaxID=101127 RepID=A0A1X2GHC5_9FUNG|nr:hypothetical protein DM01DRAFT_1407817 [Hesseltinella vesiculosa]